MGMASPCSAPSPGRLTTPPSSETWTMTSPKDTLRALLVLINSAAEDAIQQYELAGCEIPSIDARVEPQLPQDTTALKKALRVFEGACRQVSITLTPPALTMFTVRRLMAVAVLYLLNRISGSVL